MLSSTYQYQAEPLADDISHNHVQGYPGLSHNTNANPQGPTRTTPQPTGRLDLGSLAPSVSRYFQNGLVPPIDPEILCSGTKNFSPVLHYVQCDHLIHLLPNTFFCCFATYLADQELATQTGTSYIPSGSAQHANFTGPAGPKGLLPLSYPEDSSGWNQEGKAREGYNPKNQDTTNGKGPRAGQDDFRPSSHS